MADGVGNSYGVQLATKLQMLLDQPTSDLASKLVNKDYAGEFFKIGDTVYHLFSKQGIVPRRVKRSQFGSYGLMIVDKNGPFSINEIGKKIWWFFNTDRVYYQDNEVGEIVRNYIMWCKKL